LTRGMCVRAQSLPSRRPLIQSLVNDEPQMEISILCRDVIRLRRSQVERYRAVPFCHRSCMRLGALIGWASESPCSPCKFNRTSAETDEFGLQSLEQYSTISVSVKATFSFIYFDVESIHGFARSSSPALSLELLTCPQMLT
jgi:hypothetical protein